MKKLIHLVMLFALAATAFGSTAQRIGWAKVTATAINDQRVQLSTTAFIADTTQPRAVPPPPIIEAQWQMQSMLPQKGDRLLVELHLIRGLGPHGKVATWLVTAFAKADDLQSFAAARGNKP